MNDDLKVGDKLKLRPYPHVDVGTLAGKLQECTVTYIHPQRRYYVVEFTSERGERFRESRFFPKRMGNPKASRAKEGPQDGRGWANPKISKKRS